MPNDLPDRIAARLALALPGREAQARLAPELSYSRHFHPPASGTRRAAVVVLLYPHEGQWWFPLAIRPATMASHAGQISLPGGTIDDDESEEQAALRELDEELGVPVDSARLLGRLSPLNLFVTRYQITPCVAAVDARPPWRLSAAEVDQLLEVPIACLTSAESFTSHVRRHRGVRFIAPHIQWGDHRIWGATGMILAELAAVLTRI